jgi:hypothetical protein
VEAVRGEDRRIRRVARKVLELRRRDLQLPAGTEAAGEDRTHRRARLDGRHDEPEGQQRTRQLAGARSDFQDLVARAKTGNPGDRPGEVVGEPRAAVVVRHRYLVEGETAAAAAIRSHAALLSLGVGGDGGAALLAPAEAPGGQPGERGLDLVAGLSFCRGIALGSLMGGHAARIR